MGPVFGPEATLGTPCFNSMTPRATDFRSSINRVFGILVVFYVLVAAPPNLFAPCANVSAELLGLVMLCVAAFRPALEPHVRRGKGQEEFRETGLLHTWL